VEVPDGLKNNGQTGSEVPVTEEAVSEEQMKNRKSLTGFWGKFKDKIIDLFKEEEDRKL
jgi:cell division protein FtsA